MTSRTSLSALLLSLCLLLVSCTTTRTDRELKTIRDEIKKQFGEQANVRIGRGDWQSILFVTFENSQLNARELSERSRLAQNSANLVKKNFTGLTGSDEIWVMFLKIETTLAIFNHVEEVGTFRFDRNARPIRPNSVDLTEGDPLTPRATYIDNADQSDVAIRIQLEGQPGDGLTLIPHFTVAGNAEEVKGKAPEEVSFDFAFYSREQKFTKNMKIKFNVDGKSVFETTGKVSQYPADKGTFSEFCYIKFPYKTFKELTSGELLTITLGKSDYALTPDELSALRKMTQFVKD
jgi:hypothetical protein